MEKLISCYYAEYGREIDSFRAIPLNIDGLKLVERRVLWALFKINKKTKSINAIGEAIKIHPHGDMAIYDVMNKQVFQHRAIGYGSWGSLGKDGNTPPAAARYTSIQINNKVCKSSFEYINDVPYEMFDFTLEPLYLSDIIPLGLCGRNDITGIAFHRTIIPRYDRKDLAKRLKWLLSSKDKDPIGPIIKPQYNDCISKEKTKDAYITLLTKGTGTLKIIPKGGIDKQKIIHVQGKQSSSSFTPLLNWCVDNKVKVIENNQENDPYFIDLELKIPNKALVNGDLMKTMEFIWKNFLIKSINYQCYFVDYETKKVKMQGIDDVLLNNYKYYKNTIFTHLIKKFEKLNKEYFHNCIILIIKKIFNEHEIKTVDDILKYYNSNQNITLEKIDEKTKKYIQYEKLITNKDIEYVISNNSIKKLINIQIDLNALIDKIKQCKHDIKNIEENCLKLLDTYL